MKDGWHRIEYSFYSWTPVHRTKAGSLIVQQSWWRTSMMNCLIYWVGWLIHLIHLKLLSHALSIWRGSLAFVGYSGVSAEVRRRNCPSGTLICGWFSLAEKRMMNIGSGAWAKFCWLLAILWIKFVIIFDHQQSRFNIYFWCCLNVFQYFDLHFQETTFSTKHYFDHSFHSSSFTTFCDNLELFFKATWILYCHQCF